MIFYLLPFVPCPLSLRFALRSELFNFCSSLSDQGSLLLTFFTLRFISSCPSVPFCYRSPVLLSLLFVWCVDSLTITIFSSSSVPLHVSDPLFVDIYLFSILVTIPCPLELLSGFKLHSFRCIIFLTCNLAHLLLAFCSMDGFATCSIIVTWLI